MQDALASRTLAEEIAIVNGRVLGTGSTPGGDIHGVFPISRDASGSDGVDISDRRVSDHDDERNRSSDAAGSNGVNDSNRAAQSGDPARERNTRNRGNVTDSRHRDASPDTPRRDNALTAASGSDNDEIRATAAGLPGQTRESPTSGPRDQTAYGEIIRDASEPAERNGSVRVESPAPRRTQPPPAWQISQESRRPFSETQTLAHRASRGS